MSVYCRAGSDIYRYDFVLDGKRHVGSTGTSDIETARLFEQQVSADAKGLGITSRGVLRRAMWRKAGARRSKRGAVYMLTSGYFVKIGHSMDPSDRLRSIQTSSPEDCELLFAIPGTQQLERALHREFAACHYRREWFFNCGKLKGFIEELMLERQRNAPHETPQSADTTDLSA